MAGRTNKRTSGGIVEPIDPSAGIGGIDAEQPVINPIEIGAGNGAGNDDYGDDIARDADGNVVRNKDGSPRRKRGRKAGQRTVAGNKSGSAGNNKDLNSAVNTLSAAIGGLHVALASFSKCPELQLDDSESKALSESIVNVMDQFDMSPDPRIVAVGGLIATASTIYGPRMYLIKQRRKEEKDNKKNVVTLKDVNAPIDPSAFNFTGNA